MLKKNIIGVDNYGFIETAFESKYFNEPVKVTKRATYTVSGRVDHNCTKVFHGNRGQIAQVVWMGNSFSPTVKFLSARGASVGFFMFRDGGFGYKPNDPNFKGKYVRITKGTVMEDKLKLFFKTVVKRIAELKGKPVPVPQPYITANYEESWNNLIDTFEKEAAYKEAAKANH